MIARANTTVSVLRGTSVNDDGDEYDNLTIAASGIEAAIMYDRTKTVTEPGMTPQTVEYFYIRVPRYEQVFTGDILGDESTSEAFIVDTVTRPRPSAINMDQRVWAHRIQNASYAGWPLGTQWDPQSSYTHYQNDDPLLTVDGYVWDFMHNLSGPVDTNIFDEDGTDITDSAEITHPSENQTIIYFDVPVRGKAVVHRI